MYILLDSKIVGHSEEKVVVDSRSVKKISTETVIFVSVFPVYCSAVSWTCTLVYSMDSILTKTKTRNIIQQSISQK